MADVYGNRGATIYFSGMKITEGKDGAIGIGIPEVSKAEYLNDSELTGGNIISMKFPEKEYTLTGEWTYDPGIGYLNNDPSSYVVGNSWSLTIEPPDTIRFVIDESAVEHFGYSTGAVAVPKIPSIKNQGYRGDVGIDLFAPFAFTLPPHSSKVVSTFIRFYLPSHLYARILPRGGDKFLVGSGVIDTGYSGVLKVRLVNPYSTDMEFKLHDSIGQLVPMPRPSVPGISLKEVSMADFENLETSARNNGGRINNE